MTVFSPVAARAVAAVSVGVAAWCAGAAQAQVPSTIPRAGGARSEAVRPLESLVGDRLARGASPATGSLSTRADVVGDIVQQSTGFGGSSQQTVSIGAARGVSRGATTAEARGSLSGSISQSSGGSAGSGGGEQRVSVGSLAGALAGGAVRAEGALAAAVIQTFDGSGDGAGRQVVDVGGIADSSGGLLQTQATVGDGEIVQFGSTRAVQEVRVGRVLGATVQSAQTKATLTASVSQASTGAPGGAQRVDVGSISHSSAAAIVTSGALAGTVSQLLAASGLQSIDVGTVRGIEGAGQVATEARLVGTVAQSGLAAAQELQVATVSGGAPAVAVARAAVMGDVTQIGGAGGQRIQVGTIERIAGVARTDVVVTAALAQISPAPATTTQILQIGTVQDTQGDVATRVVVGGPVSQVRSAGGSGSRQQLSIGSVAGTGATTVRTDVSVGGGVTQTQAAGARERQTVLLGAVVGP